MSNATVQAKSAIKASPARRVSSFLFSRPKLRLGLLLAAPLTWLILIYVFALVALLVTAFWTVDSFTSQVRMNWSFDNIQTVLTNSLYRTVTLRTLGIALLVTVADLLLAFPIAFFMAKIAGPRLRRMMVIAILMPLWASYLVKAYAWRAVLSHDGLLQWMLAPFGGQTPGYGLTGVILTQGYLWLPYVILPIFTGLEKVPNTLMEASSDLGSRNWSTIRRVVLPLLVPSIVAASIFSFSLTLGDYITVNIVGGASQMLGNLVYTNVGAANNLPMAAAVALIPIVLMFGYLSAVRKTGALESL
jgi:putative spermidine/putrescine transport system permease protein